MQKKHLQPCAQIPKGFTTITRLLMYSCKSSCFSRKPAIHGALKRIWQEGGSGQECHTGSSLELDFLFVPLLLWVEAPLGVTVLKVMTTTRGRGSRDWAFRTAMRLCQQPHPLGAGRRCIVPARALLDCGQECRTGLLDHYRWRPVHYSLQLCKHARMKQFLLVKFEVLLEKCECVRGLFCFCSYSLHFDLKHIIKYALEERTPIRINSQNVCDCSCLAEPGFKQCVLQLSWEPLIQTWTNWSNFRQEGVMENFCCSVISVKAWIKWNAQLSLWAPSLQRPVWGFKSGF